MTGGSKKAGTYDAAEVSLLSCWALQLILISEKTLDRASVNWLLAEPFRAEGLRFVMCGSVWKGV